MEPHHARAGRRRRQPWRIRKCHASVIEFCTSKSERYTRGIEHGGIELIVGFIRGNAAGHD